MSHRRSFVVVAAVLSIATHAQAQTVEDPKAPIKEGDSATAPASTTATQTTQPTTLPAASALTVAQATSPDTPLSPSSPARKISAIPHPLEAEPAGGIHFTADPIGDGAILAVALGFAAVSELIISTGEIHAQQIDSSFQSSQLLGIDRGAISQQIDPNAGLLSTVGLAAAAGFAVLHPILSGVTRGPEAFLVDAVIYGESMSIAWGVGDLAKIAVRRPRPIAYIDRNAYISKGGDPKTYDNPQTDSSLSFYSGHVTEVAAVSATATYLMFARYPHDARPWITLIAGSALTTFVAVERVRSGAHCPTDTLAGAMAGAGIGTLVAHLHRADSVRQRPVWVGFSPSLESKGGVVTFGGAF
ncbi:MAG: phosphatase PAP2 family protein [Polyangiaceae bacterium]